MKDKFIMILTIALSIFGLLFFLRMRKKDNLSLFYNSFGLSKSKGELAVIADAQYSSLRELGFNKSVLFGTLFGLNKDDLIYVYNIFGKKARSFGGSPFGFIGYKLDLMQWYDKELTGENRMRMYDIWKKTEIQGVNSLIV